MGAYALFLAPEPISVEISPQTINLNSRGKWITVVLSFRRATISSAW